MDASLLKKYNSLPADQQQTVNDFVEFLYAKEREKNILRTVCGMGFKDGYEFAALRMFGIDCRSILPTKKNTPVDEIKEELARKGITLNVYLDKELLDFTKENIAEFGKEVAVFEQKYQMKWEEMDVKFHDLQQFDLLEKEDDYMNWVTYIDLGLSAEKTLKKLEI